MGSDQTKILKCQPPQLQTFKSDYTSLNEVKKKKYGNGSLLKDNKSDKKIFAALHKITDLKLFELYEKELDLRLTLDHPNILKILGYTVEEESNLLSENTKYYRIYNEWEGNNLLKEIKKREKNQFYFPETEMWYMLKALVNALSVLEVNKIHHGDPEAKHIFVTEGGIVKIIDHGMVHPLRTGYIKTMYNREKCLLAPEFLGILKEGVRKPGMDWVKADVYVLGMTMLYIATLENPKVCYNFETNFIDDNKVNEFLSKTSSRYSQDLVSIIKQMLDRDWKVRPNFTRLWDMLQSYPRGRSIQQPIVQQQPIVVQKPIVQQQPIVVQKPTVQTQIIQSPQIQYIQPEIIRSDIRTEKVLQRAPNTIVQPVQQLGRTSILSQQPQITYQQPIKMDIENKKIINNGFVPQLSSSKVVNYQNVPSPINSYVTKPQSFTGMVQNITGQPRLSGVNMIPQNQIINPQNQIINPQNQIINPQNQIIDQIQNLVPQNIPTSLKEDDHFNKN